MVGCVEYSLCLHHAFACPSAHLSTVSGAVYNEGMGRAGSAGGHRACAVFWVSTTVSCRIVASQEGEQGNRRYIGRRPM